MEDFAVRLFQSYEHFKENSLFQRRFKHRDIIQLIKEKETQPFNVSLAGLSYEEREIFLIKTGTGPNNILLWSQMHGNEPTATQALFDVLNFLENPREFEKERDLILHECTLYFIPMLNPDGCERFIRRNAQGIDMNRDALKLDAPESKILMRIRDEINADYGFNLHDQDIWYAAGNSRKPASISFLAPSYNYEKETDEKRLRSMQIIVSMNEMLQQFIPGQTAKYNDDFMLTAFGDNVQMKGTSTILIESGGQYNDPDKQYIRKLNVVSLLHAFMVISEDTFKNKNKEAYSKIPVNIKNKLFDYILRNCFIQGPYGNYTTDIGIRSISGATKDTYEIADIGDLRHYSAYIEKNMKGVLINTLNIGDDALPLIQTHFKSL